MPKARLLGGGGGRALVGAELLQKGAEGGDASAGSDHEDGRGGVVGEVEARRPDEDARGGARQQTLELRRAHALLGALLGAAHRLPQHFDGEGDARRVGGGRGRDGVESRRQLRHKLEEGRPRGRARGHLVEQLRQPAAVAQDVVVVLRLVRRLREATEALCLRGLGTRLGEQQEELLAHRRA